MFLFNKVNEYLLDTNDLNELSSKLHLVITLILLIQNIPITFYRYFSYPIVITYVNIIEISIYGVAVLLYFKNKALISIFTSALGIPILFSYLLFFETISSMDKTFLSSYWFLLCFMFIYSILIRKNKFRFLYIIFVFVIYFIPGSVISYNYPGDLIKLIQFFTLTIIPLMISSFIEKQDSRINKLNQSLKQKLEEKERLTKKIEIKNEELITFTHIMSHDLKAPIRTINSFTQLLRKRIKFNDKKNEEYFQFIEDSSGSMNFLIDDLLTYYKIEAEENTFEPVNISSLVHEIKTSYQIELNNGEVQIDVQKLPLINGDRNLLRTLFYNLISNSIKFQPKIQSYHIPTIKIYASENDKHIFVFISDNGIGISDKYLEKLFNPFQRFHSLNEYKGTGLGMSICKRVMDKHKGQIVIESTSKNGTTIKLVFPKKLEFLSPT